MNGLKALIILNKHWLKIQNQEEESESFIKVKIKMRSNHLSKYMPASILFNFLQVSFAVKMILFLIETVQAYLFRLLLLNCCNDWWVGILFSQRNQEVVLSNVAYGKHCISKQRLRYYLSCKKGCILKLYIINIKHHHFFIPKIQGFYFFINIVIYICYKYNKSPQLQHF